MSQVGVQTKNVLFAPLAAMFLPHSQNGGAALTCMQIPDVGPRCWAFSRSLRLLLLERYAAFTPDTCRRDTSCIHLYPDDMYQV